MPFLKMDKLLNDLIDFIIMNDLFTRDTFYIYNTWINESNIKINSHKDLVLVLDYINLIKTTDKELLIKSAISLSVT